MQINKLKELGWGNFFQSQLSLESLAVELPFRVTSVQRNLIECLGLDEEERQKGIKLSTYFWRNEAPENHPTVGDWLMLNRKFEPLYLLERKTLLQRRSAGRESLIQLISANIDTLFIVTSCNDEFNLNRIERYMALAAGSHIHTVVVLTKSDLCSDPDYYVNALYQNYPDVSVEVVNATNVEDLGALSKWMACGETVALLGSSGVGKSTIINSLRGDEAQATSQIRESDSKGRHTTTSRSLHRLKGGGILLDTPGMRELQMLDNEEGIQATFADIDQLAKHCRFHDCQHGDEPGCAVTQAVAQGQLEQRRLHNYRKLIAEQIRNNESLAERRQHDRALGRFYKNALKSSRRFKSRD